MIRADDYQRPVVCPDTGEEFDDVREAVAVMRLVGRRDASAESIARAIESGTECCGRYFDWKFPRNYGPGVRRAGDGGDSPGAIMVRRCS